MPENAWRAEPTGAVGTAPLSSAVSDHYLTNPIARASSLMAELSANAKARGQAQVAAE